MLFSGHLQGEAQRAPENIPASNLSPTGAQARLLSISRKRTADVCCTVNGCRSRGSVADVSQDRRFFKEPAGDYRRGDLDPGLSSDISQVGNTGWKTDLLWVSTDGGLAGKQLL